MGGGWEAKQWTELGLWPHPRSSRLPTCTLLPPLRVLQLFLSRTAQRSPHPSSGQLLQRLGQLLLLVLGFLVVWTAGVLEPGIQHTPLVTRGHTPTGRHFYLCHHDHWDYIMVVGELLLLSPACCWPRLLPPCCS